MHTEEEGYVNLGFLKQTATSSKISDMLTQTNSLKAFYIQITTFSVYFAHSTDQETEQISIQL